jgi:hypothetical protein
MRGPEWVQEKAQNRYRGVWRDALLVADPGVYTVALDPPAASAVTTRAGEVSAWLIEWRQWAAQHPDVILRARTIRTKFGTQPIYTHIDIPDTTVLAGLNSGTAAHWQRARARWDQLHHHEPGQTVRPWLARIVELDDYDFTTLLAATAWFRTHPRSGLTVRSVPVHGMHTKWLARHRGMVLALLGTPTTSSDPGGPTESSGDTDPVDIPADDLDALGLRPLPREIGIVFADPVMRAEVGGLRQISAPADELADLQIQPDAVLIVENKEPAVAWSDTSGLVIIHSLGNHLDVLSCLPWIRHGRCWYWGDLDRHGFTLLSRARTMVPQLASLLMAPGDIETYRLLGVEEDLDRYDQPDPTLTLAEATALGALKLTDGNYLRTEQERIPISDAEHALKRARNHVRNIETAQGPRLSEARAVFTGSTSGESEPR